MTKSVTPEKIEQLKTELTQAERERAKIIAEMRQSNPKHWTLSRLARYWHTNKQNISNWLRDAEH